ncbi:unnamed protein product [Chrysoparadoxa australica]
MGSYFSRSSRKGSHGKAVSMVTQHDRAMLDLKMARDNLQRYQKKLARECDVLVEKAQLLVKEDRRDTALTMLKIKKYKMQQAGKADAQLLQVSQMIETVQWEKEQQGVFSALKEGNLALEKLHNEIPIEELDRLMEDTDEAIAYSEEISNAIAGGYARA